MKIETPARPFELLFVICEIPVGSFWWTTRKMMSGSVTRADNSGKFEPVTGRVIDLAQWRHARQNRRPPTKGKRPRDDLLDLLIAWTYGAAHATVERTVVRSRPLVPMPDVDRRDLTLDVVAIRRSHRCRGGGRHHGRPERFTNR